MKNNLKAENVCLKGCAGIGITETQGKTDVEKVAELFQFQINLT